ncbi:MAG: helix-turn-helix transcriptional regulator [Myxococcales bacterium]|nr:helix-turn-helix transcriptional regulator [Myxococcales bacterium]MDH5306599.1 helix-turn-helix transcriptional regulator [Myxococcales bacterium]MDH5567628.1 helix-turn-helix transcriptional regulator [Myxococcales bacterium]
MQNALDAQTHRLIDRLYESAVRPEAWTEVLVGLSELFGGSPVLGELYFPERTESPYSAVGLDEKFLATYQEAFLQYVPWALQMDAQLVDRFRVLSDVMPGVELAENEFYLKWMKPQGLAPIWPLSIMIPAASGQLVGGLMVFRREVEEPFTQAEIDVADALVSHFGRAIRMRLALDAAQRVRAPLADALDRLPLGLLVLDRQQQVLIENTSAEQILSLADGLEVRAEGPAASDPREHARLQDLIAVATSTSQGSSFDATGFMQISRPSGRQAFSVMVSPLLAASDGAISQEGVVALFISDPEADYVPTSEALSKIYALTRSEADIVQLLSKGLSLDEIAADRGISMNTARSHLKHVFSKTGTSRQSELLGLVMSGVGSIRTR